MNAVAKDITTILLAIVSVAIVAVLVSKNANTSGVLTAASGGFSNALATAEGAVTGYQPHQSTSSDPLAGLLARLGNSGGGGDIGAGYNSAGFMA